MRILGKWDDDLKGWILDDSKEHKDEYFIVSLLDLEDKDYKKKELVKAKKLLLG